MLLDELLPHFHFQIQSELQVEAPIERAWTAVLTTDMSSSRMVRFLFLVRGMPIRTKSQNLMEGIRRYGFVELAARQYQELVIGAVGRPWRKSGGYLRGLDTEQFLHFREPGYVRLCANLLLTPLGRHSTRLFTETRVEALDDRAFSRFAPYWTLFRQPSGWIRKSVLKDIAARSL